MSVYTLVISNHTDAFILANGWFVPIPAPFSDGGMERREVRSQGRPVSRGGEADNKHANQQKELSERKYRSRRRWPNCEILSRYTGIKREVVTDFASDLKLRGSAIQKKDGVNGVKGCC